jgi:hypothetical protein
MSGAEASHPVAERHEDGALVQRELPSGERAPRLLKLQRRGDTAVEPGVTFRPRETDPVRRQGGQRLPAPRASRVGARRWRRSPGS